MKVGDRYTDGSATRIITDLIVETEGAGPTEVGYRFEAVTPVGVTGRHFQKATAFLAECSKAAEVGPPTPEAINTSAPRRRRIAGQRSNPPQKKGKR
jgi:hypothetical protein